MKKIDLTSINESGNSRPSAGAYACTITKVEDFPSKEYLKVTYDIAAGEYRGYYNELRGKYPNSEWIGAYVKSYKTKALPMFKRFCTAVSRSNPNFVFDGGATNSDEKTLVGKKIGIVLQEEEYYGNDGEKKTRMVVAWECPIDKLDSQKIPGVKALKDEPDTSIKKTTAHSTEFMSLPEVAVDEVPFV